VNEGNDVAPETAGRDPGAPPPAPGSLRLVQALVNTLSVEQELDLLSTVPSASRWLTSAGLVAATSPRPAPAGSGPALFPVTGAERAALIELREAIRGVLATHAGGHQDPEAASRLTVALAPSRLAVRADPAGRISLTSADHDPFARVVGAVAIAIAEAGAAGTWARLKSCPGHLCSWAFYDRSAAGRSVWCSMQLCGARAKMRAYRLRQDDTTD
jgi:predicted RNA-binding Zn ribbon-like protein